REGGRTAAFHAPRRRPSPIVLDVERQDAMRVLPGELLHDRAFHRHGFGLVGGGRMMRRHRGAHGEDEDQDRRQEYISEHGETPGILPLPGPSHAPRWLAAASR